MLSKDLYKVAKKLVGIGGSLARAYCGLPSGAAWCNAHVCYVAYKGSCRSLYFGGSKQTYCPTSIRICRSLYAQIPPYLAMPMDIIYFDWEHNGTPNHIGFVKNRINTSVIRTHEGNTSGGIVAEKNRTMRYVQAIFRPHFKAKGLKKKKLDASDPTFEYQSVYMLQYVLGLKPNGILNKKTVKALQKKAGCAADGSWQKKTSKAVQKMIGTTADGDFYIKSVKALKSWINKQYEVMKK